MRRAIVTACLSVLCLLATPESADAWFWRWVDDLSGPRFRGFDFELRVLCGSQGSEARKLVLGRLRQRFLDEETFYRSAAQTLSGEEQRRNIAAAEIMGALAKLTDPAMEHVQDADKFDAAVKTMLDLRKDAQSVALGTGQAAGHAAWSFDTLDAQDAVGIQTLTTSRYQQAFNTTVVGGGLSGSICPYHYLDIHRTFVAVNASYGDDGKDDLNGNKMLTAGVSFHWSPADAISLGAGFGVARFYSAVNPSFSKLYVQPLILDIRPLSIWWNPRFSDYRLHSVYLRYSQMTFPGGFEANRFNGGSEAYPTELVHSVAVFWDLEPYFRHKRGKLWSSKR